MCNPRNWQSSSTGKSNFSKSGWIRVLQEGLENVCSYVTCHVTLIGSWQSKHPKLHQAVTPVYPVHGRSPNKQWLCAGVFFLPSPSPFPILTRQPLPWNHFLTRSNSRSVWTSKSIAPFLRKVGKLKISLNSVEGPMEIMQIRAFSKRSYEKTKANLQFIFTGLLHNSQSFFQAIFYLYLGDCQL